MWLLMSRALQSEQEVLGAILIRPDILPDISKCVEVESFSTDVHKAIYSSMLELFADNKPLDAITVARSASKDSDVRLYIHTLVSQCPSAANAEYYAKQVDTYARVRQVRQAAFEIARLATEDVEDPRVLVDRLEAIIFASVKDISDYSHIRDLVKSEFDHIEKLNSSGMQDMGVLTGYIEIDNLLCGFKPGELIILAARPAVGKTALALQFALNSNTGAGLFSLEMSKQQLAHRTLCIMARIDSHRLRTGKLVGEDWTKLSNVYGELYSKNVFIDDTPNLNIVELRGKARRMSAKHNIGLILIDYLQLMNSHKKMDNRNLEVAAISRGLKMLARELNVPVIALSQLSRGVEQRENKRPRLSDLRDSGALEQDADIVMFLHREATTLTACELIIAKNRQGPTGLVDLYFNEHHTRFENATKESRR